MTDFLTYWYLLPIAVCIATIYSGTGISGSNFWAPIYLLWLKLDAFIGFWLALLSMLFGSIGGLIGHLRHKSINWKIVIQYLPWTVAAAITGAFLSSYIPAQLLFVLFGSFVIIYALHMLYHIHKRTMHLKHREIHKYRALLGGFFTGLISSGLGKLLLPKLITHEDIEHHSHAAGSALAIVFVTSLVAILFRMTPLLMDWLGSHLMELSHILVYVVPGVLLGGQIGPRVAKRIEKRTMMIGVGILLLIVGGLMLMRAYQG